MRANKSLMKSKPSHQLFLFSSEFSPNVSNFFSGNIVIESQLANYDFANDETALQATAFMELYCKSRSIDKFQNITIVLNYKTAGLVFADMCGAYKYMVAVHNSSGYKLLGALHTTYKCLEQRLDAFEKYASSTRNFLNSRELIKMSDAKTNNDLIEKELISIKQSILSEQSLVISQFESEFIPHY
jgi:hypothetical protein